jgi:hypothetical protein
MNRMISAKWTVTFRCAQTKESQTMAMCSDHALPYRIDYDSQPADDDIECEACEAQARLAARRSTH